jgi:hypothetical protein
VTADTDERRGCRRIVEVLRLPHDAAIALAEGDDALPFAADLHDHQIADGERTVRVARIDKRAGHLRPEFVLPDQLAGGQIQRSQRSEPTGGEE